MTRRPRRLHVAALAAGVALARGAVPRCTDASAAPQDTMFAESDAYERFMGRWSRQLAPLLVEFAQVGHDDRVLDVGSGTGALAFTVAERVAAARVTGIDPSSAYVEFARRHAPNGRVRFQVGDARQLAFDTGSFDRALALLVMNFIPDPARALREMTRVTRPGGVVAAVVWDYGGGMEMLRVFWDEVVAADPSAAPRDERHMPLCRAGELSALWRTGGLEDVEERPLVIEQRFASFDDFWMPFLGGQGPAGAYVRALPAAAREALRAGLQQRLPAGQDGAIVMHARAWAVRGTVPPR